MPVTCNAADAPALVQYAFVGDWAAKDFLDRRRELLRAGQLTTKSAVLFDLRQSAMCPPLSDLHPVLHTQAKDAVWPVCRAFLITTEAQYECARQLQALLGPHSVVNEIFRDEPSAFEWLSAMAGRTP